MYLRKKRAGGRFRRPGIRQIRGYRTRQAIPFLWNAAGYAGGRPLLRILFPDFKQEPQNAGKKFRAFYHNNLHADRLHPLKMCIRDRYEDARQIKEWEIAKKRPAGRR